MVRKLRISAAAATLMAVSADASAFSWQQRREVWRPPTETLAAHDTGDMMGALGWSPNPTPPPVPKEAIPELIKKRSNLANTCGYVSGIPESSLYCDIDSMCIYNSFQSVVGCCPDTSTDCDLVTACVDSAVGADLVFGSGTLWCSLPYYPSCFTHVYGDNLYNGYTLYGCAEFAGRDTISYNSDDSLSTATATGGSSSKGGSISSAFTKKKKSNTGAIAGGVVGGVAGLALLSVAGIFLARKRKKAAEKSMTTPIMANVPPSDGPSPGPIAPFPPPPPMPGQPQMAMNNMGAAGMYPPPGPGSPPPQHQGNHVPSMYSIGHSSPSPGTEYATPGYPSGVHPMMSSPISPPSVSPQPQQMYGQQPPPPLEQQQGFGAGWAAPPYQPPQQPLQQPPQQPPQQHQGFVAELPTEKGHTELRELAG